MKTSAHGPDPGEKKMTDEDPDPGDFYPTGRLGFNANGLAWLKSKVSTISFDTSKPVSQFRSLMMTVENFGGSMRTCMIFLALSMVIQVSFFDYAIRKLKHSKMDARNLFKYIF